MNFTSDLISNNLLLSIFNEVYLNAHILFPIFIVVICLCLYFTEWAVRQPPGILIYKPPTLIFPPTSRKVIHHKTYRITPLAGYKVTARVLAKKLYYRKIEADISPVDLLLAWQKMSDTAILKNFHFRIAGRWYRWHTYCDVPSFDDINKHLDNNHLIPSTPEIEHQLKKTRIGQIVTLEGVLASVDGDKGYNWTSSMSVGSTGGPRSCKVIYVTKFEVKPHPYKRKRS